MVSIQEQLGIEEVIHERVRDRNTPDWGIPHYIHRKLVTEWNILNGELIRRQQAELIQKSLDEQDEDFIEAITLGDKSDDP